MWSLLFAAAPMAVTARSAQSDAALMSSVSSAEITALKAVYYSAGGPSWTWQNETLYGMAWNFDQSVVDPCDQAWQGITCAQTCNSTSCTFGDIIGISLMSLSMEGTLSPYIGSFPSLQTLFISDNPALGGTLPGQIASLTSLVDLLIAETALHGTIPGNIGSLSHLQTLEMPQNQFSGSIPTEIAQLTNLTHLYLYGNSLSHHISEELTSLPKLQALYLDHNLLSGPVPASLGTMPALELCSLQANRLTGSLPSELFYSPRLTTFAVTNNSLSGSISSAISSSSFLQILSLGGNLLTGTLPATLGGVASLTQLNLAMNKFSGSFPVSLEAFPQLGRMAINGNAFRGDMSFIPDASAAPPMYYLNLASNRFSGDLARLTNFKDLFYLNASDNALTGSVPSLTNFTQLVHLYLHSNQLSSSISGLLDTVDGNATIGSTLAYLDLSANRLTGALPANLAQVPNLVTLSLSQNCFSGTIPVALCEATSLSTLALDGLSTAPHCTRRTLSAVSGYTYERSAATVHGTIPQCLFTGMPSLQTLHVSCNGLTGSIASPSASMALFDLSLSYNQLTGSIPPGLLQETIWWKLDLSHNKLTGTLAGISLLDLQDINDDSNDDSGDDDDNSGDDDSISTLFETIPVTVRLEENRLSGEIPDSYAQARDLSILQGNMFTCATRARGDANVPSQDPYADQYSCGSTIVDDAMVVWVVLLVCGASVVLAFLALLRRASGNTLDDAEEATVSPLGADASKVVTCPVSRENPMAAAESESVAPVAPVAEPAATTTRSLSTMLQFAKRIEDGRKQTADLSAFLAYVQQAGAGHGGSQLRSVEKLGWVFGVHQVMDRVRAFACAYSACLVVVGIPIYCGLSSAQGMYTDNFAWTVSAGFLSGQASALTLLFLFALCIAGVTIARRRWLLVSQSTHPIQPGYDEAPLALSLSAEGSPWWRLGLVNFVAVMTVHGLYVGVLPSASKQGAVLLSIAVALFNIGWSRLLFKICHELVAVPVAVTDASAGETSVPSADLAMSRYLSLWTLFNHIGAPCFMTLFIHRDCAADSILGQSTVSSSFVSYICATAVQCMWTRSAELQIQPQFSYSYQCSSSLLQVYAPVLMYQLLFVGVVAPAAVMLLSALAECRSRSYCGGSLVRVLQTLLPSLWRHGGAHCDDRSDDERTRDVDGLAIGAAGASEPFSCVDHATSVGLLLGLLVTFGTVLPYLGLMIVVVLSIQGYMLWAGLLRVVSSMDIDGAAQKAVMVGLATQCRDFISALAVATQPLGALMALFYAGFLLDVEGDAQGAGAGLGVALALPLATAAVHLGLWALYRQQDHDINALSTEAKAASNEASAEQDGLEMHAIYAHGSAADEVQV